MIFFLLVTLTSSAQALDSNRRGYIGSFAAASPMSLASDGEARVFIGSMWGKITVTDLEGKELYSFSGPGSELEGKILEPAGMYYHGGRLYVADSWYGHVIVLTPEGKLIDILGRKGHGAKQFSSPKGVFVQNELVFVADTGNGRVQVLGPNGVYLRDIGTSGGFPKSLRGPKSLIVRGRGNAFVVDEADSWVKIYDIQGNYINRLSNTRKPVGIAIAGLGYFIADAGGGELQYFDTSNRAMGTLGSWGPNSKPFKAISSVIAAGDMVYASDYDGNEIKVFRVPGLGQQTREEEKTLIPWVEYLDKSVFPGVEIKKLVNSPDGKILALDIDKGTIFRFGSGAVNVGPEGCFASSFTVGPGGDIYCLDMNKRKIAISDKEGSLKRELELVAFQGDEHGEVGAVDIGVSSDGVIFISDRTHGQVDVYGPGGEYRGPLGQGGTQFYIKDPVALRVSGEIVYIVDAESQKVFIYSTTGRLIRELWDIGKVRKPVALAVSEDYIYLLDEEAPDIKIFSKKGMHVMSFGSRGHALGEFSKPTSVELDSEGNVLVSDPDNESVQRFSVNIEKEYEDAMWEEKAIRQHNINLHGE